MGVSGRLRLGDVRSAFRLVGECRDHGGDPVAWRRHAIEGLCRLVGATAGNGGQLHWPGREGPMRLVIPVEHGFDRDQLAFYQEFMREHGPNDPLVLGALRGMAGKVATRPREAMIEETTWRRSGFYDLYRSARQEFDLFSTCEAGPSGAVEAIILHRPIGDRGFGARERRLVRLFHGEAGRLIGGPLAAAPGPEEPRLSPRLRQTLERLLAGDGEKQVAARLGLSRATVHEYVTALYRRFGVSSRAELMARFIDRGPR